MAIDIAAARRNLGYRWGLGRPLRARELARVLGLVGINAGKYIIEWERGKSQPRGPTILAIELMCEGAIPPRLEEAIPKAKVNR